MAVRIRVGLPRIMGSLLVLLVLWSLAGCQTDRRSSSPPPSAAGPALQRIVVVGFQPALSDREGPELVRNPITGTSFMSWRVSEKVAASLTDRLFQMLTGNRKAYLIPPDQVRGVVQSILLSNRGIGMHPTDIIKDIGRSFEADAVLIGQVYRWQERVGADYGIEKPASVAFDLSLIRSSDGVILWRGNYDKTQKSLLEDLFDLDTYIQGRGRWLTAEELAGFGLQRLLPDIPLPHAVEEERG